VIHVVGPNWNAGERDRSLLESCYSGALAVADELGARTVAFPLVSAGIYGWPRHDAISAAIDTIRTASTSVEEARLVAFGRPAFEEIAAALSSRPPSG
jgi:O-acetyl-ADP-ribose deacetylase (regulator of RNase III)